MKSRVGISMCPWRGCYFHRLINSVSYLTVHAHGARSGPNRTPAPPWIFLSGTVRADFFVLPDSSSFWSHFSAANYKTAKFFFKCFAIVLNYLPNEWILRGEAPGSRLRHVLGTRGEQLIPADGRKEETTLPYSFSP